MSIETANPAPEIDDLPTFIDYPGPGDHWDVFPLGVDADGEQVTWDATAHPHTLVAGPPGGGKSVAQRIVAAHALAYPTQWHVVGFDPKGIEMDWLAAHAFATVHAMHEVKRGLRDLCIELDRRLDGAAPAAGDSDLADPAILALVDAADHLVRDEDTAADLFHLARLGRAAGIHLHVTAQDPLFLPREFVDNLGLRVAHKAITETESTVLFGTRDAADLPKIHGRSYASTSNGTGAMFQTYYRSA